MEDHAMGGGGMGGEPGGRSAVDRKLDLTLDVLTRTSAQLILSVLLFVYMSYNNYVDYTKVFETAAGNAQQGGNGWTEKEILLSGTLLKWLFLSAIVATIQMSRGIRDYLFADACAEYFPHTLYARSFWRNGVYFAIGILLFTVGLRDVNDLEGQLPLTSILSNLMVQAVATLYLSSTFRDRADANEIRALEGRAAAKLSVALKVLGRSFAQIGISIALWLWVAMINYKMVDSSRWTKTLTANEQKFANAILTGFFFASVLATFLTSSGLRDYLFSQSCRGTFANTPYARGGSKNLLYLASGVAVLVLTLFAYYSLTDYLPWRNTLTAMSMFAMASLYLFTSIRDRLDSSIIETIDKSE